jgi:hypothetical protein
MSKLKQTYYLPTNIGEIIDKKNINFRLLKKLMLKCKSRYVGDCFISCFAYSLPLAY